MVPGAELKTSWSRAYYIKITKYFNNSSLTQFQKISLYVPTCDKRADWQKAHPTYAEPFNHMVTWSN